MKMVTREHILELVKKHLRDNLEELDDTKFDPAKSMKDMGANSLDIVEVVSCTMRDLKVKVPRSELSKIATVNGLVDLLCKVADEKGHQEAAAQ
jgi:acyl carrier protein